MGGGVEAARLEVEADRLEDVEPEGVLLLLRDVDPLEGIDGLARRIGSRAARTFPCAKSVAFAVTMTTCAIGSRAAMSAVGS